MKHLWKAGFLTAFILLFFSSMATGEGEQWLQYHFSADARSNLPESRSSYVQLSGDRPKDVNLPEFKCDKPLFGRWMSPMAKTGGLCIVLDRKAKNGPYDLLYIDSNGDGSLKDETPVAAVTRDQYQRSIGPVRVVFKGDDGPITYHLNFELYSHDDGQNYLSAVAGCWYEGDIVVDGKKQHCILSDYNINGTFNDKSIDFSSSDRIVIGGKDERRFRFAGNFIDIDGQLYCPEIAADGAFIKLTKAQNVAFGEVKMPETITQFAAGGENGLFYVPLDKGVGKLPVGKYRIYLWQIVRKDKKNNNWTLEGRWLNEKGEFEIKENQSNLLKVGEPIISKIECVLKGDQYNFNQSLVGQLGERVQIRSNNYETSKPKIQIESLDGKYSKKFTLEYG